MNQFLAILRDSFREAVDGFVIYAMVALSAIMIIVVGSMSFTPAPPDQAFEGIVQEFNRTIPEKGRSRGMNFGNANFRAVDVKEAPGGYTLQVRVKATAHSTIADEQGVRPEPTSGDTFRRMVVEWIKPIGNSRQIEFDENQGKQEPGDTKQGQGKNRKIEVGLGTTSTDQEERAITDAQMEDFIKNQFKVHAGMEATVKRITTGVAEPSYAFEVTTSGGSSVRGWPHIVKIFFGAVKFPGEHNLGFVLWVVEDQLINGLGSGIALLISMIITAFFIPNMLRKGSIDLLISKPIGRTQLLLYKYIGGLTFIFILSCVAIGGVWLVLCARSGVWDPTFLVVIPILTFTFAILYAVSTLVAVFTRSPIAAMLCSTGFAVFLYIVGKVKEVFDVIKIQQEATGKENIPGWGFTLVDTLNNVLPRYKDLDKLTSKLISDGSLTPMELRQSGLAFVDYPSWGGTLGVSLAFIALMLAISCWRFSKRDY